MLSFGLQDFATFGQSIVQDVSIRNKFGLYPTLCTTVCLALPVIQHLTYTTALSAAEARTTFERTHNAIYQIRVMDTAANNKTSTGTGFVIRSDGLVATNYHVVSNAVNTPDKYRIELLQDDEATVHLATVENIDVVNDLALLAVDTLNTSVLTLADQAHCKATPFTLLAIPLIWHYRRSRHLQRFSTHSASERVHFTGSLNPGMSGGPAFNTQGEIIGINVASAGNQVSFLVPAARLQTLLNDTAPDQQRDLKDTMRQQLMGNSERMINQMLAGNWQLVPLGRAQALTKSPVSCAVGATPKNQQQQLDDMPFGPSAVAKPTTTFMSVPTLLRGKSKFSFTG